ncbi:MAG: NCS2 family permease [Clostridiales bacterium]|nr:NCS2 family permease [Clostridiales bacterium]MDO5140102.1 NCS2 family permease [Eubacteriales bacterium]
MLERFFRLSDNHTDVRTEVRGGIVTFMTMAYILAVNPSVLSSTGMNPDAVLIATAVSSFAACLIMGLVSNYPMALAPAMGLNAYMAYTVCGSMGFSWQAALFAVFLEGIIFIILSLTNVREMMFNAIPLSLKKGISAGIGLFIAFIGLQNAGIVQDNTSTLVAIVDFSASIHSTGICAALAIIGVAVIAVLSSKNVKGAILIGILTTWGLGILCQMTGVYLIDAENGFGSLIPELRTVNIGAIRETFGACFRIGRNISIPDLIAIMCAFLFVDLFDTLGTLIAVAGKAGLLDKEGRLPNIKKALFADAIGTTVGAVMGTSTVSTYVESSSGVSEGARTGLASVVTGIMFLLSVFLAPLFVAVPGFATAPALIYVGFLMIGTVKDLDFDDLADSIPAYLTIIFMPLTYSISDGIAAGVIFYTILNMMSGKRERVSPMLCVLTVLFILKFALM